MRGCPPLLRHPPRESRKPGFIGLTAAGCAILALAACGAGTAVTTTDTSPSPTAQAVSPPVTAPATVPTALSTGAPTPAGDPLGLTGEGALKTVWTARHQLDTSTSGGDGYLPRLPDGTDTWAAVGFATGPGHRLRGYYFDIAPALAASGMKNYLRQQIPADAKVLGDKINGGDLAAQQCEAIVYQSALLGRAFASSPDIGDPQGYVEAVLRSSGTGDGSYDPNQVDTAEVTVSSGASDLTISC